MLSPLLSNILLDDLDKELERRGHRFARYADDCNIYVKSQLAGQRVMASLERFLRDRLKLTINRAKSAVDRPWRRKFLGYGVTWHRQPKLKVAKASEKRFKDKVRTVIRRGYGRSLRTVVSELTPLLRGWCAYFRLAQVKRSFEELDGWVRRKLRRIVWAQWRRPKVRARKLRELGLPEPQARESAYNGRGGWWNAGAPHMHLALPNALFRSMGLPSLLDEHQRLARC